MTMNRTAFALITTLAFAACQQQRPPEAATLAPPSAAAEAHVSVSPEQLGELGARIEKNPADAQKLLAERGLDEASFEKAIRQVSSDPAASQRYRDAYNKARG